ncbi:MAG: zinc-ribbon domain-containing protein [Polyangiaceae bacterium]|nr:zinc-ribbon domain-containing protein [Polyangiaceae bacterium]
MKFSCPGCQAKYQIADAKVAGRRLKMKCKKCGVEIPVDGRQVVVKNQSSPEKVLEKPPLPPAQPLPSTQVKPKPLPRAGSAAKSSPGARKGRTSTNGVEGSGNSDKSVAASKNIAKPLQAPDLPPAQDMLRWYAGIDNQKVGPLNLAELRQKVHSKEIAKETFLWRDGLAGWAPLSEIEELAELAETAAGHGASPPTLPPNAITVASLFELGSAPQGSSPQGSGLTPEPPQPVIYDPEAPVLETPAKQNEGLTSPAISAEEEARELLQSSIPPRRSLVPLVVAVAISFGVALGFLFFGGQEVQVVEKVVEREVEVEKLVEVIREAPQPKPAAQEAQARSAQKTTPKKTQLGASTKRDAASAPSSGDDSVKALTGLDGLNLAGPRSGPQPGAASSSSSSLTAGQIQAVVSRYRTSISRRCWQPALQARDRDAPTTARVQLTMTVDNQGKVTRATSSGDPRGYRGLSQCIRSKVRAWRFPKSGSSQKVEVPFVFAAQ